MVTAKYDKWSVLKEHIWLEFRVQVESGVTHVQLNQSSDLNNFITVHDDASGTANDTLKNPQEEINDAHSAHTLIVSRTFTQLQISLDVAAKLEAGSISVGGNNIPFHGVDQLTTIFVHEIFNDQVINPKSFGFDSIFIVTQLRLSCDHTDIDQVNVVAHVLVTVQESVIGSDAVVNDQVLLKIAQELSIRLIKNV